jgi:WD40 repeat protein
MAVLPPDPVYTLTQREMGAIDSLCFHKDERLFAGTKKGQIYLFDLQTNRSAFHMTIGQNPLICIHHTEDYLISMEKGGAAKLRQLTNSGYKVVGEANYDHAGFCRFDCNEEDGIIIAPKHNNTVSICTLDSLKETQTLVDSESAQSLGTISCLKYLKISEQPCLLTGYESGVIQLWDLRTNKVMATERLNEFLTSIDYDLVTHRGIAGNASDKIDIFSINSKSATITKRGDVPIKNPGVHRAKIRKDLKVFVTAGWDGRIRIFSWKTLRPLAVLTEHKGNLMDIAFSEGKVSYWKSNIMAAGGSDGKITLWDIYN